jgi:hypothetical protein
MKNPMNFQKLQIRESLNFSKTIMISVGGQAGPTQFCTRGKLHK